LLRHFFLVFFCFLSGKATIWEIWKEDIFFLTIYTAMSGCQCSENHGLLGWWWILGKCLHQPRSVVVFCSLYVSYKAAASGFDETCFKTGSMITVLNDPGKLSHRYCKNYYLQHPLWDRFLLLRHAPAALQMMMMMMRMRYQHPQSRRQRPQRPQRPQNPPQQRMWVWPNLLSAGNGVMNVKTAPKPRHVKQPNARGKRSKLRSLLNHVEPRFSSSMGRLPTK
jgi:hypothetical protein